MCNPSNHIRNILVAGHAGCGKTTLVEALLYSADPQMQRPGTVQDGTAVCDFDPEEQKRQASLALSLAPVEYDSTKLNLLDAPGLFDFGLGVQEGILAADSVLVVVSARSGVTVGAEKAFHLAEKAGKSCMVFVNKTDLEHANYYKILEELKTRFGPSICPCVVPVRQEDGTLLYINLFSQKAFRYECGKPVQVPMPDMGHRLDGLITAMSEAVAETDEALMEKFFSGEPFTTQEIVEGLAQGCRTGAITPVFCGSAANLQAMDMLLYNLKALLPSPAEAKAPLAQTAEGEPVELACDAGAALAVQVFKTVADPFVGKLSYIKVLRGTLTPDAALVNARTGEQERMGKLLFVKGKKQTETAAIGAGDLGAVTKLLHALTGDTLCQPGAVVQLPQPRFAQPTYAMALKLNKVGDEAKIGPALTRLVEEDPTLHYYIDQETGQQILSGQGEQHLDVALARLKAKFGVEVQLETPRIPYRESLRKPCKAQGRHKKQTGGHGQFGDVWIEFAPCDSEELVFQEKVVGGSVPKNYFPAVEKGLRQAVQHGVLAGYPVVGIQATLLDGSYHPVDSSEMAFMQAAKLAYKAALPQAQPILLEPVGRLEAHLPADDTGDLMGEITKRRGRVLGMNPDQDGLQTVQAQVPMAEMQDFTAFMRQLTQGRGWFTFAFAQYEPLPGNLTEQVIAQAKTMGLHPEDE